MKVSTIFLKFVDNVLYEVHIVFFFPQIILKSTAVFLFPEWFVAHSSTTLLHTHQKTHKEKVFQILKFTDDILKLKQACYYFVIQIHIVFTRLHGMQRDLLCNPTKVVVSGKVLFVPGGRKWDSLRDWVSRGWRGISHSVPFRTDVILSSPSLGCLSWQPKKACAHPTVPTARLEESLLCSILEQMGPDLTMWFATGRLQ